MTKIKSVIEPVLKEFQINKCGFDHLPPDDFVKSQWQTRTKSFSFLLYRCVIAIFYMGVVVYSMIDDLAGGLYFIYLTNWGIMLCMCTAMLGAILVSSWYFHPEYADHVANSNKMPTSFKVYWGMHVTTLILSMVITIVYWSILYNDTKELTTINILTHALNSALMFIDLWIVAYPVRLLHMFLPVGFGATYAIFSVIYYVAGGVDPFGKDCIYPVLNWADTGKTVFTVIGVLLLCCALYVFIFSIYKLRIFIHRRCTRKSSLTLTATPPDAPESTASVTAAPNRISMVLGNYGHDHLAYTGSSEKVAS